MCCGGCLACCACCACKCCVSTTCTICGKVIPVSLPRVLYVATFLIVSTLAWVLGNFLPTDVLHAIPPEFKNCPEDDRACLLNLLVDRLMFGMAVRNVVSHFL